MQPLVNYLEADYSPQAVIGKPIRAADPKEVAAVIQMAGAHQGASHLDSGRQQQFMDSCNA